MICKIFCFNTKKNMMKIIKKTCKEFENIIKCQMELIDILRFMSNSLSNLNNSFPEKYQKKCIDCECFVKYEKFQKNY